MPAGKPYRQNRLFQSNQLKVYQESDGKSHEENQEKYRLDSESSSRDTSQQAKKYCDNANKIQSKNL